MENGPVATIFHEGGGGGIACLKNRDQIINVGMIDMRVPKIQGF